MTVAPAPVSDGFWALAPGMFERASAVEHSLERSLDVAPVADAVRELARMLPKLPDDYSDADPYLTRALHAGTIDALLAVDGGDRRELRIAVERVRQALRDMLDERPVWRAGPKDAAVWLGRFGLSGEDLSKLFGVSADTSRRWVNPGNAQAPSDDTADRVVVVAKIVNHLKHAMSPRGAVQWLLRPHPTLDGRRPVDDLKDAASYQQLIRLASGARSSSAT